MNKTTLAASCTYLHQVSPSSTQPTSKGLRSQPFLKELVWRDLKDNSNVLVPDLEQGQRQNLPVIFGVTGLCLNVTVTKPGQKADSVHPAHVIISSDSVIHLQSVSLYSSRSPIGSRGRVEGCNISSIARE